MTDMINISKERILKIIKDEADRYAKDHEKNGQSLTDYLQTSNFLSGIGTLFIGVNNDIYQAVKAAKISAIELYTSGD